MLSVKRYFQWDLFRTWQLKFKRNDSSATYIVQSESIKHCSVNIITVCLLHNELNNYDTVVIGYFTSSFAIATLSTTGVKYEDPFVAHLNLMLIGRFMWWFI